MKCLFPKAIKWSTQWLNKFSLQNDIECPGNDHYYKTSGTWFSDFCGNLVAGLWPSLVAQASLPQPVLSIESVEDPIDMSQKCSISSYEPRGIPLKPNLVSFSNLNPCPSNRSHKRTILVRGLVF